LSPIYRLTTNHGHFGEPALRGSNDLFEVRNNANTYRERNNPMNKFSLPEPGSPWTSVFARSTIAPSTFSVRHTQAPHMMFLGYSWGMRPAWDKIVAICKSLEVPSSWICSGGSPGGNTDRVALDFALLDGGVFSRGGCYFGGLHGAWIYGVRVLRFLCYELNLTQPKVTTGETGIPSHEELRQEIAAQKETAILELKDRIATNPAIYGS
jgi:hypothetical protein